jgi:hypothetical protein
METPQTTAPRGNERERTMNNLNERIRLLKEAIERAEAEALSLEEFTPRALASIRLLSNYYEMLAWFQANNI